MRQFFILLKKEIKELLTLQLILPFLIVVVMFALLGNYMQQQSKKDESAKQKLIILDEDKSDMTKNLIANLEQIFSVSMADGNKENLLDKMKNDNIATAIIFPGNFQQGINNNKMQTIESYTSIANFSLMNYKQYNVADTAIASLNNNINNLLIAKNTSLDPVFIKNPVSSQSQIVIKDKVASANVSQVVNFVTGQVAFIPIILFLVIVLAAQMIATAVATEKENKTLETLLSLPIDRKTIVASKMLAAGIIALIMAGIYMYGYKSYMTGIAGDIGQAGDIKQIASNLGLVFNSHQYILLGLQLFLSILVALGVAIILGAFAQDAKSAQSVIAPLMMLIMIPYFLTMLIDTNSLSTVAKTAIYAIPFSHSFLAAPNLLLGNYQMIWFGIIYQIIIFIILIIIAGKIFSTDYIITMNLNWGKKK